MRNRISRIPALHAVAALVVLAAAVLANAPASARTFGLVIGINDYTHLPKLKGAVNDARDIAAALKTAGAEDVTVLLDAQATRNAVLAAWEDIVARAEKGDTVVFSYAGHGGQEYEKVAGSEADGLDEVFLLTAFQASPAGNAERIVDNDLNRLFSAAPHLNIIFIADSCHSGTMTRSFDPRAGTLTTRLASYQDIEEDQLPKADPKYATLNLSALHHVVFFGAVQDHEVVMELPIDGASRGALSWSFARALRGYADNDGDSLLTASELETYLIEKVRTISEGRQFPQIVPEDGNRNVSLLVPRAADLEREEQTKADTSTDPAHPLRLVILKDTDPVARLAEFKNVVAAKRGQADLIWDTQSGEVISATGDIVARLGTQSTSAQVQAVVDKWLLLRDLGSYAETKPLALRIDAGFEVHHAGKRLQILLAGHRYENLTLFNLAVDGTVQFLVPWPPHPNKAYHGKVTPQTRFAFPLKVSEPFGADHLVAVVSDEPLTRFHAELLKLDGKKNADQLRAIIAEHLKEKTYQIGYVGLHTAP